MREISPLMYRSAQEFYEMLPPKEQSIITSIRQQKANGTRSKPSLLLLDKSKLLSSEKRLLLVDKIASLVDENLNGRSNMCIQFALLSQRALSSLNFPARAVGGQAVYFQNDREVFRWDHAWVRIDQEVVDGNVDCLYENPAIPPFIKVNPYWGPIRETPDDRRLIENLQLTLPTDDDVENIWWPELKNWIEGF